MSNDITVIKLDPQGQETWRYEGRLLEQQGSRILLEALFNASDRPFMGTSLKRGDRFVETYFTDRWYNIFEIYDRDDASFKGWYGNVSTPARLLDGRLEFSDLFLDVWMDPAGTQTVLDEDEFEAAKLEEDVRQSALEGLGELREYLRAAHGLRR
jgi:predicted RNA-binding protein associated with RNAse of E/G family